MYDSITIINDDKIVNAFCTPGGFIFVYTGLIKLAEKEDHLASVIGHEIAHVISKHGAERVSQGIGLQLAMTTADALSKNSMANPEQQQNLMSALGLGAKFGVLLPFSRSHETEADLYGLDLMSKAGFDPRESVKLWKNMSANNKGQRIAEFLSTHPDSENRIRRLDVRAESAKKISAESGNRPRCY